MSATFQNPIYGRRAGFRPGSRERRSPDRMYFLQDVVSRPLLVLNIILSLVYLGLLGLWFERGNIYIFTFLMVGEVYHVWQILTYIHTIWSPAQPSEFDPDFKPPVDIYITVCGEPVDVVEQTVRAALSMRYNDGAHIYILNDGLVAHKDNWKDIEALAKRLGTHFITRKVPGGAKAGNINHALTKTSSPFFAVFDADHIPHADFLECMMGYFKDPKVAFVQSPQFYRNRGQNYVAGGAWEQQELFFGTICTGKQRLNSVFMCGTNMVLRRTAIAEVGGISQSITEDFLTSQFIHARGWKSVYVPRVLAQGLAPEDFLSYSKQQFRWARGSLELLIKYNPFFQKGLSLRQKMQYAASASFYLSGLIVLANAIFPLIFFFTGAVPFHISTMILAVVFLPYIFLTIYILRRSTGYHYSYRAVAFSMGAFWIHIEALFSVIFGLKNTFVVTSKKQIEGNFINLVIPHLIYIALVIAGFGYAVMRQGLDASVVTNLSWALFNVAVFIPFILAAMPSWTLAGEEKEADDEAHFMAMRKNL
jgi:cellulose synthase (UDP-forming)